MPNNFDTIGAATATGLPGSSSQAGPSTSGPSFGQLVTAAVSHSKIANPLLASKQVRTSEDHNMDDMVFNFDQVNEKLSIRGEVLQPGAHLPSFKKGFLDQNAAQDVLKQYINKANVLL